MREFVVGQRITLSPDGRFAAYVWRDPMKAIPQGEMLQNAGWRFLRTGAPDLAGAAITVRDLVTGAETNLEGTTAAWGPSWAQTGDTLAFMADRDGRSGLWIWRADRRAEPQRVTPAGLTTAYYGAIAWTSDDRSIVLAIPGLSELHDRPERKLDSDGTDSRVPWTNVKPEVEVRRSGFPADTAGRQPSSGGPAPASPRALPAFESDLVRVDLADGTVHVLAKGFGINWMQPSPDGRSVAYVTMREYAPPGSAQYQAYYDLWVIPLAGGPPRQVAQRIPLYLGGQAALRWSPDGRYLAYRTSGLAPEQALFVVAADSSSLRRLADLPGDTQTIGNSNPVWEADSRHLCTWQESELRRFDVTTGEGDLLSRLAGKTIRLIVSRGASGPAYTIGGNDLVVLATDDSSFTAGFFRVGLPNGRVTTLVQEDRQLGTPTWFDLSIAAAARDARIVFTAESASAPRELWSTDSSFARLERVSDLGSAVSKVPLGARRIVQWRGPDGAPIRGVLLLPPTYDAHRRYPLVVWMYEHSLSRVHTFGVTGSTVFNCQLLVTRGIACLFPDLHWEHQRVMQGLHEQVTAAIQAMVDQGIADSARVGVVGHSSGGYDTFAVLATTPTIKAAVASAGVVDMMTFYGTSSIGPQWVEQQMGLGSPPWVHPERYVSNSPSFHMDQIHTPILILQGTADTESTMQMDMAYNLLRHLGRQVEYRRYAGEGHVPDGWSPANRLDATQRMLDWWVHYLMPAE